MKKKNHIPDNFENKLDAFAPILASVSKDNPFDVPMDYLETLPEEIAAKCNTANKENALFPKFKIIFKPRFIIPVAISIIIIIFMIVITPSMKTENDQQLAYNTNENSAEYQYIDSMIEDEEIDESLFIETITGVDDTTKNIKVTPNIESNISEINNTSIVLSDSLNNVLFTDDDIIQYLLDDDDDDLINY